MKPKLASLPWYGDMLTMDEEHKVNQTMEMEVRSARAKGTW